MSEVAQLIHLDNVRCGIDAASRKRVLQIIAELVVEPTFSADILFDGLMARERLGSTGLGDGVAIPHCRVKSTTMRAALVSLAQPIDYEASDGKPVDLLFVLVVPENEQHAHLAALAELAEVFSNPEHRATLRACRSDQDLADAMKVALSSAPPDAQSA